MTALSLAVNSHDRLNTINSIVHLFDHDDENMHNEEIRQGAANALCQKLMIAMAKCNSKHYQSSNKSEIVEVSLVCKALRFTYRCSAIVKDESFRQIGNDLLPLLCSVVTLCLDILVTSPHQNKDLGRIDQTGSIIRPPFDSQSSDEQKRVSGTRIDITLETEALEGALGALRNLSCVPSAELLMSKHVGFLDLLLRVDNDLNISIDAKVNALNVIVNLAHSYVNKVLMVENTKLLDMLVQWARHGEDMIRNAAACGLQNLTAHDENILTIIKHDGIIQASLDLLNDSNYETREFATGTIQNLSVAKKNALPLASFKSGSVVKELLKVITKDKHEIARNRSVWTLGNIMCLGTLFIIKIDGVIDTLAVAAAKDSMEETRIQAAVVLKMCVSLLSKKLDATISQAS